MNFAAQSYCRLEYDVIKTSFIYTLLNMSLSIEFTKYHVSSNDFAVIDGRNQTLPKNLAEYQQLSHRRTGIGFDQAMVILPLESFKEYAHSLNINIDHKRQ